jgi:hypothetical protein
MFLLIRTSCTEWQKPSENWPNGLFSLTISEKKHLAFLEANPPVESLHTSETPAIQLHLISEDTGEMGMDVDVDVDVEEPDVQDISGSEIQHIVESDIQYIAEPDVHHDQITETATEMEVAVEKSTITDSQSLGLVSTTMNIKTDTDNDGLNFLL